MLVQLRLTQLYSGLLIRAGLKKRRCIRIVGGHFLLVGIRGRSLWMNTGSPQSRIVTPPPTGLKATLRWR
jgi:hypothetical protein